MRSGSKTARDWDLARWRNALHDVAMRLLLLRHGPAVERSEWTGADDLRPLTEDGIRRTRRMLRGARPLIGELRLLTSPWTRARETAAIAEEILGLKAEVASWLVGDGSDMDDRLRDLPRSDALLVGHEPDLGELLGLLIGAAPIPLKKAGLAVLAGDPVPGGMTLRTLLSPKDLAALVE